jgi:hypothetical protein
MRSGREVGLAWLTGVTSNDLVGSHMRQHVMCDRRIYGVDLLNTVRIFAFRDGRADLLSPKLRRRRNEGPCCA